MTAMSAVVLAALCFICGFILVNQAWPFVARAFKGGANEALTSSAEEDLDAYSLRVLGVYAGAGADVLRSAYEGRMAKYDPASFTQYGPEFEALAIERRRVIDEAYRHLVHRAT